MPYRNYGERPVLMSGDYGYTGDGGGMMAILLQYDRLPNGINIGFRASRATMVK